MPRAPGESAAGDIVAESVATLKERLEKELGSWEKLWEYYKGLKDEFNISKENQQGVGLLLDKFQEDLDKLGSTHAAVVNAEAQGRQNRSDIDALTLRVQRVESNIEVLSSTEPHKNNQVPSSTGPQLPPAPQSQGLPSNQERIEDLQRDEIMRRALNDHMRQVDQARQDGSQRPAPQFSSSYVGPGVTGPNPTAQGQPQGSGIPAMNPLMRGLEAQSHHSGPLNQLGNGQQPTATQSLVTTSNVLTEVPNMSGPTVGERAVLGMFCPGLKPHRTMVHAFTKVVDYRAHRLSNTEAVVTPKQAEKLGKAKKSISQTTVSAMFTGEDPIDLLGFLRRMVGSFNMSNVSEGEAALMLPWHLGDTPRRVVEQQQEEARRQPVPYAATWPYLVHALITRFLDDQTLREAYDAVASARQKEGEDEDSYCDRLQTAASACHNVFSDEEVVQYFIQGLQPVIRGPVSEKLRERSELEQRDIATARRLAVTEGKTHRLRLEEFAAKTQSVTKTVRTRVTAGKTTPIMTIGNQGSTAPGPAHSANPLGQLGDQAQWTNQSELVAPPQLVPFKVGTGDSFNTIVTHMNRGVPPTTYRDLNLGDPETVVRNLFPVLSVAGITAPSSTTTSGTSTPSSVEDLMKTLSSQTLEGRPVNRQVEQVPVITAEQLQHALSIIPTDYWSLNCWTCRESGHTTFTCPYLTWAQRLYFAYRYYLHQIEAKPQLSQYYADRERTRQTGGNQGQRPRSPGRQGGQQYQGPPQRQGGGPQPNNQPWLRPNSPGRNRPQRRVNFIQKTDEGATDKEAPGSSSSDSSESAENG